MKIGIMQPYFFPYLGYFHLINSVDKFIFYDDVNFIKGGWINRNRIISNSGPVFINVLLNEPSSFELISNTRVNDRLPWKIKMIKSIENTYRRAPNFDKVFPLIESVINQKFEFISQFAIYSVTEVSKYLGISTNTQVSSQMMNDYNNKGVDKIISICKNEEATQYINPIGGMDLYDKNHFLNHGIALNFVKSNLVEYKQFNFEFLAGLSIIDVLMFNSKEDINEQHLNSYTLV